MNTQDDIKLKALFGDADVLQDAKTGRLVCSVQAIANLFAQQRAEIIAMLPQPKEEGRGDEDCDDYKKEGWNDYREEALEKLKTL